MSLSAETRRKIVNERLTPPERSQATPAIRRAGPGTIRAAYCKVDAGEGATIACYLDTDLTGEEVTVHCNLSDGEDLNECIRRLGAGNRLEVYYDGENWRAIEGFQGVAEDCEE